MKFTPEEIAAMAKEAGMHPNADPAAINALGKSVPLAWIESLCALVAEKAAAKEREACAQIAEGYIDQEWPGDELSVQAESTAGDIRARGEKEGAC